MLKGADQQSIAPCIGNLSAVADRFLYGWLFNAVIAALECTCIPIRLS